MNLVSFSGFPLMEMLILLLNSRQILVSVMPFGKIIEVRLHVGLSATTPNSAPSVNSQLTAQM